jgi:serine protease AprX
MTSGFSWQLAVAVLALALSSDDVHARSLSGEKLDLAVQQELAERADAAIYGAFVHFGAGTVADQDQVLADLGLQVQADFRKYATSVFARGPVTAFKRAAAHPAISYIEHNAPLRYFGETQPWATRLRVAQEPVAGGPYYADAAKTRILDGSGVTLGVIDSGMLGAHPDFADNLLYNYKVVSLVGGTQFTYVDVGRTDSESTVGGHGTHVTGTVGGGGQASNGGYPAGAVAPNIPGTFTGGAPKAQLIHWGNGAGILVLDVTLAYRHLLDNLAAGTPGFDTLVAVNNSYGALEPTEHNPNTTSAQLVRAITDAGIVMAFAAGNDGGDGTTPTTSPECRNPYPGVVCVANYFDQDTGATDASLAPTSSRGTRGRADTADFPDVAAPGQNITSTCVEGAPQQSICTGTGETDWAPFYGTISGTSMATPHVVAAIGLIQQAYMGANNGARLSPAQIEELLQRTARRIGDGYVPDPQLGNSFPGLGETTTHFGFGAGLINVPAALDAIGIPRAGLPEPLTEFTVFENDSDLGTSDDVVRLTMADATVGGVTGTLHRLTLATDAQFFADTVYTIERKVAGKFFTTSVVTDAAGNFSNAALRNSAPATLVARSGTVVSVFVPYASVGSPGVGEPVHNIRVTVTNGAESYDFAPSPLLSLSPEMDRFSPMYGRSFTVGVAAAGVSEVSLCDDVGPQILRDDAGDADLDGLSPLALPTAQQDLLSLHLAHPFAANGEQLLVFRLGLNSTDNLVPGSAYFVSFDTPDGLRGVRAQIVNPLAPQFFWYVPGANSAGGVDGRFVTSQTPIDGEVDGNDLVFRVAPAVFGLDAANPDKAVLRDFNAGVSQSTDPVAAGLPRATFVNDSMPNGLGRIGRVTVLSNADCAGGGSGNSAPVAADKSVSTAKDRAVSFTLGASDADGDPLSYAIVTQPAHGSVSLDGSAATYTPNAGFVGSDGFTFKANDGRADSNVATVSITVTDNGGGGTGPMTATLSANPTSGDVTTGPLTVNFTASGTSPGFESDTLTYTFHFGDGSTPVKQTSPTVQHAYGRAGSFKAYVIVTDQHARYAVSDTVTITTTTTVTVTDPGAGNTEASLEIAQVEQGPNGGLPVAVTFDASASRAASQRTLTGFTLAFGDGESISGSNAPGVFRHVYTVVGQYTATLTVTDSAGATSTATATVTVVDNAVELTAQLTVSPSSVNVNDPVSFNACASLPRADIVSYTFRPAPGVSQTQTVVNGDHDTACRYTYRYPAPGTYTPELVLNDGQATAKATVQVRPVQQPPQSAAPRSGSGAIGLLLLLPLAGLSLMRRRSSGSSECVSEPDSDVPTQGDYRQ